MGETIRADTFKELYRVMRIIDYDVDYEVSL